MTSPTISMTSWAAEPAGAPVRLTPRGRRFLAAAAVVALTLSLMVVLFGAAVSSAAPASDAAFLPSPAPGAVLAAEGLAQSYTVQRGDTLWDLAGALDPGSDPRPIVDEIQQINGLADSTLTVGQQLWLPVDALDQG